MRRIAVLTIAALALGWLSVTAAAVPAPADARVQIPIEDSPALGPADAPVTIVEFSDFLCPYSALGTLSLKRTFEAYPGQIRWVFKHFPLGLRSQARLAHRVALAAGAQGRFWDMHLLLFQNQRWASTGDIMDAARSLGFDVDALTAGLADTTSRDRVLHDVVLGRRLGVVASPTYFVNGVRVVGARSAQKMRGIVEREIRLTPDRTRRQP